MKRSRCCRNVLALFLVIGVAQSADAGMIIVSGDTSIGNPLDGTVGSCVTPGNATFFTNLLGGGTNVLIRDTQYGTLPGWHRKSADAIHAHYNRLGGVTSRFETGRAEVTRGLLAGVDVFIDFLPGNNYRADEISAMSSFLADSGTLFLLGERAVGKLFDDENARINDALSALGSTMRLEDSALAPSFQSTSSIGPDSLTAGVGSFAYSFTNTVSGGTPLIRTRGGHTFIAYEEQASEQVPLHPNPEPSSIVLLSLGAVTLAATTWRRRKRCA